jgi:hypothetical protein
MPHFASISRGAAPKARLGTCIARPQATECVERNDVPINRSGSGSRFCCRFRSPCMAIGKRSIEMRQRRNVRPQQKLTALYVSVRERHDCTDISFPRQTGETRCGTALDATTLGGFVKTTSNSRSREKEPAAAAAPAHLARSAIENSADPDDVPAMPAGFKHNLS